eukprot:CAMPEP_0170378746 /NCGR_PEP_ID=MMETSP0117_2-20130122/12971_1 /TAXON_ID=400756 /ORGANISM="Durinskia baltica, Strain CSIRO CS-38" /LENGTH=1984 /DNA_ID=CAMNT_0010634133 /DNA_START=96 /DNA_END=6050 /DNA_ORIENTATION=-
MSWDFRVVSGNRCPRQFEYHPSKNGMVFGTISGEVCAIDIYNGENRDNTCTDDSAETTVPIKSLGYYGKNHNDTMLGLCWLRPQSSDAGGSIFGESRGNGNLFLSGSSRGRVCLGDVSREFDPTNSSSYSIVHEYPVFEKLTSVHVNSTNELIILSGYSTGVNIVDAETSKLTRDFKNIHQDHINISRFSTMSPNLFATSSFDGTIKTWDLRQSCGTSSVGGSTPAPSDKPIYTVQANSGVVMINFSVDDNFILASALDNEINQYLFLDGRKHLTYNIPRTGLKSNFTRAYYSASGRHTLTGACEENTVKIMCTYTGEPISSVPLYPGRKDKSLYIQSLRGCPTDEDQICVLCNYHDLQNRELIMVTRDHRSHRSERLDALLSSRLTEEQPERTVRHWFSQHQAPQQQQYNKRAHTSANKSSSNVYTASFATNVAADAEGGSVSDTSSCVNDPIYPPHHQHTDAWQSDVDMEVDLSDEDMLNNSFSPYNPSISDHTDYNNAPNFHGTRHEGNAGEEGLEEEYEYAPNNSLMCLYSMQYVENMRKLLQHCATLVQRYAVSDVTSTQSHASSSDAHLSLYAKDDTVTTDCCDLAVLVHPNSSSAGRLIKYSSMFVHPIHTFVLKARCPVLYKLWLLQQQKQQQQQQQQQQQRSGNSSAVTSCHIVCGDSSRVEVPVIDLSWIADVDSALPTITRDLLPMFPVLISYLYAGNKSVDVITTRYYTLQQIMREAPPGGDIAAHLSPLVGEVLQAELEDYAAMAGDVSKSLFSSVMNMAEHECATGLGDSCVNNANVMFLPVQDALGVEILLKICVDDHCWRQSSELAVRCVKIVEQLMELAHLLQLRELMSVLSSVLEVCICPLNAVPIYDIAVHYGAAELIGIVLRFIANHHDLFKKLMSVRPDVHQAVADLTHISQADVISRADFRDIKAASAPQGCDNDTQPTALQELTKYITGSIDSDDENSSQADATEHFWQHDEIPFLPQSTPPALHSRREIRNMMLEEDDNNDHYEDDVYDQGDGEDEDFTHNAVACLPRMISCTVNPFLETSMIFLGGQNLERLHTFGNRILTYNYSDKMFRHIATGGTHTPKCGYMSCAAALQKTNPTHLVLLGGKVKKSEVSVQHSSLPQHLRAVNGVSETVLQKLEANQRWSGSVPKTDGSSHDGDTVGTTGQLVHVLQQLQGMGMDTTGPVSVLHNRLIDVWNLNAEREELSRPTAEAYAAQVSAALNSLNASVDEEGQPIRLTRAQELMKKMGLIYELDYETLTWRSPSVELSVPTQITAYNMQNAAVRAQYDQEMQLMHDALHHRIAQTACALYEEDVTYRCRECLFSAYPALPCNCTAHHQHHHQHQQHIADNSVRVERCWIIQFGGFCDRAETILADLHVLHCERKVTSDPETGAAVCASPYSYRMIRASASGTPPAARFSHSSTVVPADVELSRYSSLNCHTRVLFYGGAGYHMDNATLVSLRINRSYSSTAPAIYTSEFSHYAHWEVIREVNRGPSVTQGHTMVHIPGSNLCVLHGGAYTGAQGQQHNQCTSSTWILRLLDIDRSGSNSADPVLTVQWTMLSTDGICPTPRSRHCSFTVSRPSELGAIEIMVFGGVDEIALNQRRTSGDNINDSDFDDVVKDSVLHTLHMLRRQHPTEGYAAEWLPTSYGGLMSPPKDINHLLFFPNDTAVRVRECTLTRDMLQLLDAVFGLTSTRRADGDGDGDNAPEQQKITCSTGRMKRIIEEFCCQRGFASTAPAMPLSPARGSVSGGVSVGAGVHPNMQLDIINTDPESLQQNTTPFALYQTLLCSRCSWFRTLLNSDMKGGSDASDRLALYDVDPCAFRLLLVYVYSDALMISSLQDIVSVLELANQFDLPRLAQMCEGVLIRLTTLQNVCELLDYADTLNLVILKAACISMILRDVIQRGKAMGCDYSPDLFRGISDATPYSSSMADVQELQTKSSDPQFQLVHEFIGLSSELRCEIARKYKELEQVYGSGACG